jgi:hydroxyacylglutathione hydrolase
VTLAGPGREQEQQLGSGLGGNDASLVRLEGDERPGVGLERVGSGLDSGLPLDDDDERVLLHLVVPKLLAGLEPDQHGATFPARVENHRRTAPAGGFDLAQPPAPHVQILILGGAREAREGAVRLASVSLVVDRYELGPIGANGYVVRSAPGVPEAAVVDPGGDSERLVAELERMGAACAGILVTHSHWDHLGGVADLAESSGAKVHMPALEAPVLAKPGDWYPDVSIRGYAAEVLLEGGETIALAGITFETIPVPGHSPGHLAYYADGSLFSGDVLFAGSVGRTDLPFADWDELVASIRSLMERFPPETVVYSGHGPETTLGAELARNPFLAELRAS